MRNTNVDLIYYPSLNFTTTEHVCFTVKDCFSTTSSKVLNSPRSVLYKALIQAAKTCMNNSLLLVGRLNQIQFYFHLYRPLLSYHRGVFLDISDLFLIKFIDVIHPTGLCILRKQVLVLKKHFM